MKSISFPMHLSDRLVGLDQVVSLLPVTALHWSILDFDGIGTAPDEMSMDEFQAVTHSTPGGYRLSWQDLRDFASRMEQTFECLIVGARVPSDFDASRFDKDDFRDCCIVLQAFDSTEWSVSAHDSNLLDSFRVFC